MPSANITLNVGWTKCLTYSGIVRCRILGNLLPWGKIEFAHPVQVIHRVRKNVNVMLAPLLRTIRGTLDRYRLLQSVKSFIVVLLEALYNTIRIIGAGVLLHKLLLVYGSRVVSPGVLVDNGGGSWAALWYGLWRDHVQWYFQHITHTQCIYYQIHRATRSESEEYITMRCYGVLMACTLLKQLRLGMSSVKCVINILTMCVHMNIVWSATTHYHR